ncbi:hypothetical protein OG216_27555 [Streptomycetaceae bacterium NBC_01309]
MGNCGSCNGGGWVPMDGVCGGCGGSGRWSVNPEDQMSCGGCGGSGRAMQMQPCPNCGGSGGFSDGGAPVYAAPRAPLSRAGRLKVLVLNLVPLGGLAAYVYYTTR